MPYVSIDIETTGLGNDDEIIELAAAKVGPKGAVLGSWSHILKPTKELTPFIQDLTGITPRMIKKAPTVDEVRESFNLFIGKAVLIGHNINKFDLPFLNRYNLLNGYQTVDTLELARERHKHLPQHNLDFLCDHFGIHRQNAHRALDDAIATIQLYYHCI